MELKQFESSMIREVVGLFEETILTINRRDYSEEQVKAWANNNQTSGEWVDCLENSFTYVAMIDDKIVGFGNLTGDGLFDLLYVHKDHQAKGIGSAIIRKLEAEAKLHRMKSLSTDASTTAKPFFLSRGYDVFEEQIKWIDGISFINYKMIKQECDNNDQSN